MNILYYNAHAFRKHPFEQFPSPVNNVKSEREELIDVVIEANNAKNWLLKNFQHSWWNGSNNTAIFRARYNFGIEWLVIVLCICDRIIEIISYVLCVVL